MLTLLSQLESFLRPRGPLLRHSQMRQKERSYAAFCSLLCSVAVSLARLCHGPHAWHLGGLEMEPQGLIGATILRENPMVDSESGTPMALEVDGLLEKMIEELIYGNMD